MGAKSKFKKGISREFDWKIDYPAFIKELVDNTLVTGRNGIFRVPIKILNAHLTEIAQRATELNDPILNELMIDMNLYELPPMLSKERRKIVRSVRLAAQKQKEKEQKSVIDKL